MDKDDRSDFTRPIKSDDDEEMATQRNLQKTIPLRLPPLGSDLRSPVQPTNLPDMPPPGIDRKVEHLPQYLHTIMRSDYHTFTLPSSSKDMSPSTCEVAPSTAQYQQVVHEQQTTPCDPSVLRKSKNSAMLMRKRKSPNQDVEPENEVAYLKCTSDGRSYASVCAKASGDSVGSSENKCRSWSSSNEACEIQENSQTAEERKEELIHLSRDLATELLLETVYEALDVIMKEVNDSASVAQRKAESDNAEHDTPLAESNDAGN